MLLPLRQVFRCHTFLLEILFGWQAESVFEISRSGQVCVRCEDAGRVVCLTHKSCAQGRPYTVRSFGQSICTGLLFGRMVSVLRDQGTH